MERVKYQDSIAKVVAILVFLVTVFTWKSGTDPVNIPKEFLLVIGSFYLGCFSYVQLKECRSVKVRLLFSSLIVFSLMMVFALVFSDAPMSHQIYGVFGRSLGFLTYFSLAILCFVVATSRSRKLFNWVEGALHISFIYNSIICLLQINGIEVLGYNNIWNAPLGTFGNPNFISAFLGIFVSWVIGHLFSPGTPNKYKILVGMEIFIAVFLIIETNSRQGLLIIAAAFLVHLYFYVQKSLKLRKYIFPYLVFAIVLGFLGALGVFNIGPLANLIYKTSISLRIEYWRAATNMLFENPLNGVGLNSYGDWYRELREPSALILPGVDTVTNSAHSIPLDFAAVGGFPLLISYLVIQVLVIHSIIRIIRVVGPYNREKATLVSAWFAFTLQSLISIDQIGVSIWGWVIFGLIISNVQRNLDGDLLSVTKNTKRMQHSTSKKEVSMAPVLLAPIIGVIGLMIVLPNFRADLDWGKAIRTGDINQLKAAADAWPQDEMRIGTAAFIFGNNKLWDEALVYSEKALSFNPRSYSVWRMILNNPRADLAMRRNALMKMRELDPNNENLSDALLNNVGGK
jgi:hypothetical protein